MARIDRKHQKVFAGSAENNGQFGSAQLGTKVTSNDPDTIQQLTAFLNGWNDATISGQRLPTLEEMQALHYLTTRQLAYLFQEGIAEWNTDTEYHQNSIVRKSGTYELFGSLTDDNQGNALTDTNNWTLLIDLSDAGGAGFTEETDIASAATTDLGDEGTNVLQITGTTTITSFGSSAEVAAPIYLIRFADSLTLTHNGTSLILPGGANITTAAGDTAMAQYLGSGNWKVLRYTLANGEPIAQTFRNDWPETAITAAATTLTAANASGMFALDATSNAVELKLPDTGTIYNGFSVLVRCVNDDNAVTVVDFADAALATMREGQSILFVWNGSAWVQPLEKRSDNAARIIYEVASGTDGYTSATTWEAAPINTLDYDGQDVIKAMDFANNRFTLAAGVYEVSCKASVRKQAQSIVHRSAGRLWNHSDSEVAFQGNTHSPFASTTLEFPAAGIVVVTADTAFQYQIVMTGTGLATTALDISGTPEVYTEIIVRKLL